MIMIDVDDIRRHGITILLGQNRTATEGEDGLPTLTIRHRGKIIQYYRGSSLQFSRPFTDADRAYLAGLASDKFA